MMKRFASAVRERGSAARVAARRAVRQAKRKMRGRASYQWMPMAQGAPRAMGERSFVTYRLVMA